MNRNKIHETISYKIRPEVTGYRVLVYLNGRLYTHGCSFTLKDAYTSVKKTWSYLLRTPAKMEIHSNPFFYLNAHNATTNRNIRIDRPIFRNLRWFGRP